MPLEVCERFIPPVIDESVTGLSVVSAQVESELSASAFFVERQRDYRRRFDRRCGFAPCEYEPIHWFDLEELASGGKFLVGLIVSHRVGVDAADAHVERYGIRGDAKGAQPLREFGVLGPCSPHQFTRGSECANDCKFGGFCLRSHDSYSLASLLRVNGICEVSCRTRAR